MLLGLLKGLWGLVEDERYGDVLFGCVLYDMMVFLLYDTCIEERHRRYAIADLNSEHYLYLLHKRDDISWLTIADSCSMAVCRMTHGTGRIPGTMHPCILLIRQI